MKRKICFICSSGGHLEQIFQLKRLKDNYEHFYVINETKATREISERKYFIHDLYRGKSKLKKFTHIVFMFMEQFMIFIKEKPDIIVTTGAGMVVPMCLISKLFGKKVIYIESFARINTTSKAGKFLYKYTDLFIVQWEKLLDFYPNAIYGGWIY